jgi:hypothetical protein
MRKILFAAICLIFLTFSFISFQNTSSQIQKSVSEKESPKTVVTSETPIENNSELDDQYMPKRLRFDIRMADVVTYVDVKEVKLSGSDNESTDCENKGGPGGYCFYDLTAEVKEVYKGNIETKSLEFSANADSSYPKENFLGERVFFLKWTAGENKGRFLVNMENSSRLIKHNVIEKISNILDPNTPIDENDEKEPYSFKYISQNLQEADAVVYADVLNFKSDKSDGFDSESFILKAKIKEVFKGGLKAGQIFEYKDERNFEYEDETLLRPMCKEDLGEQILYLKKKEKKGKVFYEKVNYMESWIQHDILEKLRKIAKEDSIEKN